MRFPTEGGVVDMRAVILEVGLFQDGLESRTCSYQGSITSFIVIFHTLKFKFGVDFINGKWKRDSETGVQRKNPFSRTGLRQRDIVRSYLHVFACFSKNSC